MMPLQTDLFAAQPAPRMPTRRQQAEAARDQGIARAERGAERADPGWGDKALAVLKAHMHRLGVGGRFQVVDVRLGAYLLDDPPEPRAWGAVVRRATRAGWIVRDGYAPCNDPRQHLCPTAVWRVVALPR